MRQRVRATCVARFDCIPEKRKNIMKQGKESRKHIDKRGKIKKKEEERLGKKEKKR